MLRKLRIFLAIMFFVASAAYFTIGTSQCAWLGIAQHSQIIPSALAATLGVTIFWIGITFLLGRVYCSTVCPVGTYQDFFIRISRWLARRLPRFARHRHFSYRPARNVRYHILAIYLLALIIGVAAVSYWIEPWNMMRNMCSAVHPEASRDLWRTLGIGSAFGIASGVLTIILLGLCAVFTGRGFCTAICPIGTALGLLHAQTIYHIEIDPDKCVNCMECEAVCKSHCIKVAGRFVDNSRCVRCFDCTAVCRHDAIRFQSNRNRRANPMLKAVRN